MQAKFEWEEKSGNYSVVINKNSPNNASRVQ